MPTGAGGLRVLDARDDRSNNGQLYYSNMANVNGLSFYFDNLIPWDPDVADRRRELTFDPHKVKATIDASTSLDFNQKSKYKKMIDVIMRLCEKDSEEAQHKYE